MTTSRPLAPRAGATLARHADPIVALATAPGRGAVGIIRLSGPSLAALMPALCGRALLPRHAHRTAFIDAQGQTIDEGLALYFPAPHSYTGEDVIELQAHGGPVVLQLLLARCLQAGAASGLRLAAPGEFTQRAYLNGKLDLAQAEAVADLIDASTEAAARGASRALQGQLSREVEVVCAALVQLRMRVEATLDFPEEDVQAVEQAVVLAQLRPLAEQLQSALVQAQQGRLLREGLRVVLAGQPNVGKSSLLNALAGAELAIVTPIAGTTRDRVSETIQIEGVPVHVTDTAGLRQAQEVRDDVERIGIDRSWQAIENADAVIFLRDATRVGEAAYDVAEAQIHASLSATPSAAGVLQVFNKDDVLTGAQRQALQSHGPADALFLSARDGHGLQALRMELLRRAGWQPGSEAAFIARERHVQALRATQQHVDQALELLDNAVVAWELLAEELRLAHEALTAITGAFTPDDLLGEIFSRFCIGK